MSALLFPRTNFGARLGLDRIRTALGALGNPQRCAPVLHVAGTNGKGSTCAFAEAALRAAGLRVGLYTSPHLLHFCERIRIDGEPLSEGAAAALFEEIAALPGALDPEGLTFFECATALGFLAFARAKVDVMVIEVGLGGRLDATNLVEPLATAVAPLGLEHTQYLGPTLAHIAREKAGIFKRGATAVSAGQPAEAANVLQREADRAGAPLWRPGRDYRFESREGRPFCYAGPGPNGWCVSLPAGLEVALLGHHQRGNAALACALLEAAARKGLLVGPGHAAQGVASARWPGRLELVADRPLILVDGAHNPHAARALAASLPAIVGDRPLQIVFGVLSDKDAREMLRPLVPLAQGLHLCAPDSPRAVAPDQLLAIARSLGATSAVAHPGPASLAAALHAARRATSATGAVLICGSLYLAGEALALLRGVGEKAMPGERL